MRSLTSLYNKQNEMKIEWNIGKRCNLDCSYCPPSIHDNFSKHTPKINLIRTIDKISKIDSPINLSFTGGEPCVHPNISEILQYARQKIHRISVTTNGLRTAEWYAKQPVDFYVFSLHFDNDMWEKALENMVNFANISDIKFMINVMAHHSHISNVKFAVQSFDNENIKYVIRRIRWTEGNHDSFDDNFYSDQDLEWILSKESTMNPNCIDDMNNKYHANDIIKTHLNQFKGWRCNAGLESLMINWDGEVHRATCRVGGSLGNIYKGSFEIPNDPVICTRNWCTCAADIPITKVRV